MANWDGLRSYIGQTYNVAGEDGNIVRLVFDIGNGRTQLVLVSPMTTGAGAEFALIASPIGDQGTVDLAVLLREVSEYIVGGIALYGSRIMLRHAVPLADLDVSDFEVPLHLVLGAADAMEAKFFGTDQN